MRQLLALLLFASFTPNAPAADCQNVELKIPRFDQAAATERRELCAHGKDQWSSPDCARDQAKCKAKWQKLMKDRKVSVQSEGFGTPGFDLCKQLGGVPLMATVSWAGKESQTDFCSFAKDGLVDLELLENAYSETAKSKPAFHRRR